MRCSRAFSLAELSIVLIIIGLLVAGVSTGNKMIQQSKVNGLIREMTEYKSAIYTFKSTYDALPGDMGDAISFWTNAGNLLNGNADNLVIWVPNGDEVHNANLHLSKAELIPDQGFTGTVAKYTMDLSSFSTGVARIINLDDPGTYLGTANVMQFGAGQHTDDALLLPKDTYAIDKKIDDSLPKSGKMMFRDYGTSSTNATCTNSSTSYYLSSTTIGCAIVWDIGM